MLFRQFWFVLVCKAFDGIPYIHSHCALSLSIIMFRLCFYQTTLHNRRLVVQQHSQIRNKSSAARRYRKGTTSLATQRQRIQWYGMTPAWKRHLIHQKRSKTLHNNNSIIAKKSNTCTSTKSTTTTTLEERSSLIDQIKSFSIGSFAGILGSLAGMGGGFVSKSAFVLLIDLENLMN